MGFKRLFYPPRPIVRQTRYCEPATLVLFLSSLPVSFVLLGKQFRWPPKLLELELKLDREVVPLF